MSERQLKKLEPKELPLDEQLSVAVFGAIIRWGRANPASLIDFDPVEQYAQYVTVFGEIAGRELGYRLGDDVDEVLAQLNMTEKRTARLLELSGIGYPLPVTQPAPRYV